MNSDYENEVKAEGFNLIIGVDEAGRGPLAGPVVASAVALKSDQFQSKIGDSKTISVRQREKAFYEIYENAHVGVGIVSESVIDRGNILEATFLAMTNAIENAIAQFAAAEDGGNEFYQNVCLLIDGNLFRTDLPYAYRTVVGGDSYVLSIACASIVAKVTRDRILNVYDLIYPQYGFKKHKGYPTPRHKEAISTHGLSLIHRRSYKHSQ
ncbi:MAG: ribonuclease HII [Candidatus Omnitrophica bacterium]|nr:ribonuclease HII [Candidatus Omnitrophota bacterium]